MPDILVLQSVQAVCQDGVTREGGSLVVRDDQYVFLDADGVPLEGERSLITFNHAVVPMAPHRLSMITSRYGPILS